MQALQERTDSYVSTFSRVEGDLPGRRVAWLKNLRQEALARFQELGLPNEHHEDWRFTRLEPIAKTSFALADFSPSAPGAEAAVKTAVGPRSNRLVFLNGQYWPQASGPFSGGLIVQSLAAVLVSDPAWLEPYLGQAAGAQGSAFVALNTAFFRDGALIRIPKGAAIADPVHLLFITAAQSCATVSYPRVLVVAEEASRAAVIEEYLGIGSGVTFTNAVSEVFLEEGAGLDHYKVQRETEASFQIATTQVQQKSSSNYFSHVSVFGGTLVRNDLNVVLKGEGSGCALNGLYIQGGRQHVDNHTLIDHSAPHTSSRELYKGVLDGRARAVFNGAIIVRPDAQKVSATQANRNLLLSDGCLVNTKPEFKIYANDVQCKHGATIGQISPDALFYLRCRGIDYEAARQMLVYAFTSEIVDLVRYEPLRMGLAGLLAARLPVS